MGAMEILSARSVDSLDVGQSKRTTPNNNNDDNDDNDDNSRTNRIRHLQREWGFGSHGQRNR
jgi:hypothetical protein